jgi:ankyrin repeat protein
MQEHARDNEGVYVSLSCGHDVYDKVASLSDPTVRFWYGQSLLHAAARGGSARVVELLLSRGLDANDRDSDGITPLHVAACGMNPAAVVPVLLASGADANAADRNGCRPVHFAMTLPDATPVINALVNAGADVQCENLRRETPAIWADGLGRRANAIAIDRVVNRRTDEKKTR